jgi:hypothetical protein
MGRKSRRSRAAKLSRDGHATRPPSLAAGQVYGELRVIEPDTGERRSGKRVALVEDIKTGERKRVIASNISAGRTVSAGRIQRARYAEWIETQKQHARYTDIDELDRELLNAGLALHPNDVDVTGKPLRD